MSWQATCWARQQQYDRPVDKLVMWAMADAVREEELCFLSLAAIVEFTGLDRKTIIAAQARLKDRLIVDTGERRGATRQIIVWRLLVPSNDEAPAAGGVTVPEVEPYQKRNGPVSSGEASQKRDTEPVLEPVQPSEASPPSVERGAKRERAHKLPDDWQPEPFPNATMAAGAVEVWPPGMLERELSKFRDYWRGNGKRMVDWQATWRNWVVRADEQRGRNRDRGGGRRGNGLLDAVLDAEHHGRP